MGGDMGIIRDSAPSVTLRNVALAYDRQLVVRHLSGVFLPGCPTAIVGPNGAGKSSVIKAVAGLKTPAGGQIAFHGTAPGEATYLPQLVEIDTGFPISVRDVVLLGLWRRIGAFRALSRPHRQLAERALAMVGLEAFEGRSFAALSVGQRQRVLFARLLVADARLILLDEPFTAIDGASTDHLLGLVGRWQDEGRTVIAILHDLDQVRRYFPQTLLLAREPVAWGPTEEALCPSNLRKARAMSDAWEDGVPSLRGVA
jgi:zinc/manganese transport system ATP-binding protein